MDNWGEVIYIVLITAFVAQGLLTVVKKSLTKTDDILPPNPPQDKSLMTDPENPSPQMNETTFPPEKSLLETISHEKEREETVIRQNKKKRGNKRQSHLQSANTTKTEPMPPITDTSIEPETPLADIAPLKNADDLKRAIIYAEILNRKYS